MSILTGRFAEVPEYLYLPVYNIYYYICVYIHVGSMPAIYNCGCRDGRCCVTVLANVHSLSTHLHVVFKYDLNFKH